MHPHGCAGDTLEGAAEAASEATTGEDASGTEAALVQAQHAQHEAMLAGEASLNASRDRLLDVREAMQQSHQDAHGMQHPSRKQHCVACSCCSQFHVLMLFSHMRCRVAQAPTCACRAAFMWLAVTSC